MSMLGFSSTMFAERSPELQNSLDDVIKWSRRFLTDEPMHVKSLEKNGFTVYKLVEGTVPGEVGVGRVGEIEIGAPAEDIAEAWWNFNRRKEWDNINTEDSRVIREEDDETRFAYVLGKPKSFIPALDAAFYICKVSPGYFQLPLNAYAYVQVNDNQHEVPDQQGVVRGDFNSIILISPIMPMRSKVQYLSYKVVDEYARGQIIDSVGELAADDIPLTIGELKKHFDNDQNEK